MLTLTRCLKNCTLRLAVALVLLVLLSLAATPGRALADGPVFWGEPGEGAPPPMLGPYTMAPFPADLRPAEWAMYATAPGPNGDLLFDREGMHIRLNQDVPAELFGHGYAGSVYFFAGSAQVSKHPPQPEPRDRVEISLPAGTMAFYMYVDANTSEWCEAVVSAGSASSGPVMLNIDEGARYFGFYSTGEALSTVVVEHERSCGGVAIGDLGIFQGGVGPRADVGVVIYGGWGGMPVQAWVGGSAQPMLLTAPNHEGHAAALFTFWPPDGSAWRVTVAPGLPAGLDPDAWELRLLSVRRGMSWDTAPRSSDVTITRGAQVILYYQLVHTGG